MNVTGSTRRALLVVGVAAVLVIGVISAVALWQRQERRGMEAVLARLDAAAAALERERRRLAPVDREENAAPALLEAARGIPASCRGDYPGDIAGLLDRPVGTWTAAERAAIPPPACAASLEALRTAAARPQVAFPPTVTEISIDAWQRYALTSLLWAARLLSLDAREAAETGQRDRLAADLNALTMIGTGLAREDALVVGIIADAVHRLELRLVRRLVESGRLPMAQAVDLRRQLQARVEFGDALARSLVDQVRLFTASNEPWPSEPWILARQVSGIECGLERLLQQVDETWTQIERVIDDPPARCVDDEHSKILLVNLRDAFPRIRATDAARQLAIVALTVYERGAWAAPERVLEGISLAAVPNRYDGERVEVETADPSSMILRYPRAEERARAARDADSYNRPLPFEYRLTRDVS